MLNQELHPLTAAREARNLSQAQLAEEVRLGPRTIWAAEHQRPISAHSRRQLCRYFKKTAQELGLVSAESVARARKRKKHAQQLPVPSAKKIVPALSALSREDVAQSAIPIGASVETVISPEQLLLCDMGVAFVESGQKIVYDSFEVDVMIAVLQHRLLSEPVSRLQRSIQATIKEYDDMTQHDESEQIRLSRRHALQAIAKFPIQLYALTAFGVGNLHLAPAEEILPACAAGITACRALLKDEAVTTIEQILAAYLPTLETLARQNGVHQQTAAHLTSQSYLLATILADHHRKLDHMEAYSRAARRYGQLANDPNLEASALARLAVKFDYERRDRKALQIYQEALALPKFEQISPLLRGRIYAGLAGTHAYCRQPKDALYFLGLAKDTYPQKPEDDSCFHFAYSGENTMALWEGLTNKHIDHYADAWNAFSQYAKMQPQSGLRETNRAEFLNYVASVAVKQRDLDAGILYLEAAEEVAWTIQHEQRYAEILDTFRSLQIVWADEPAIRRLQDKFSARDILD